MKKILLPVSIVTIISSNVFATEWPAINENFIAEHKSTFDKALDQEEKFKDDWRGPSNFHNPIKFPLNNDHWGLVVASRFNPRVIISFDEVLTHLRAGNLSVKPSHSNGTNGKPISWGETALHVSYDICPTESGIPALRDSFRRSEMWNDSFGPTWALMELILIHSK